MRAESLSPNAEIAFKRYCELHAVVQAAPTVANAIACGKAWGVFLDAFIEHHKPKLTIISGGLRQ